MVSCREKKAKKSTSCGQKSKASIKAKKSNSSTKNRPGRNPFFHYLAFFRKCNRCRLCHLPSCKIASMASRRWTRMSPAEREPFVDAANSSSYTYRARSKKVNWLLLNLQEYIAGGECQAVALWKLMRSLKSWQQHCVRNEPKETKEERDENETRRDKSCLN